VVMMWRCVISWTPQRKILPPSSGYVYLEVESCKCLQNVGIEISTKLIDIISYLYPTEKIINICLIILSIHIYIQGFCQYKISVPYYTLSYIAQTTTPA
jgi:hypothetical protein